MSAEGVGLLDLDQIGAVDGTADRFLVDDANAVPATDASKWASAAQIVIGGLADLASTATVAGKSVALDSGEVATPVDVVERALTDAPNAGAVTGSDGVPVMQAGVLGLSDPVALSEAGVLAALDTVTPAAADAGVFVQSGALKKAAISSVVDKGVVAAGNAGALTPGTDKVAVVQSGALVLETIQTLVRAELAALLSRGGLVTEGAAGAIQELAMGVAGSVPISNGTDLTTALITQVLSQAPPKGLDFEYLTTTTFRVRAGSCWTADGLTRLALASNTTVNIAANGANGMDRVALAGTVSGTSGTKAVTGVGTAFLTGFGRRVLTGTFANGGGTTTITAMNGDPVGDAPAIGDLVGDDSIGYRRVIARDYVPGASYTLIVSAAHASFSGATLYVIEAPTFSVTGDATQHAVDQIASDTSLTLIDNLGASPSGAAAYTGTRYPYRMFYVWLCTDGGLYVSPRSDAPHNGLTGRVVGLVPLAASGAINGRCFLPREGWLFRVLLTPPSATSWNGTVENRLQEVAANTQPVRRPRTWKVLLAVSIDSTAANGASAGLALYGLTGASGARLYTLVSGFADNAETGSQVFATAQIEETIGDGSVYGLNFYNVGSGGTITGTYRRDGVEVML